MSFDRTGNAIHIYGVPFPSIYISLGLVLAEAKTGDTVTAGGAASHHTLHHRNAGAGGGVAVSVEDPETPGSTKLTHLERHGTHQVVRVEPDGFEFRVQAHLGGDGAGQEVLTDTERLEDTEVGDERTDSSRDVAIVQVEALHLLHLVQFIGDGATDGVVVQTQVGHVLHHTKLGGDRTLQVVPVHPHLLQLLKLAEFRGESSVKEVASPTRKGCIHLTSVFDSVEGGVRGEYGADFA